MNKTTNYELNKPEGTDFYDIDDFNDNMDTIDTELAKKAEVADVQITIPASGWSNKSQTIAVVGLDPEDTAIVSIDSSDASGYEAARDSDIRLTGRANGTLTFNCEDVPTSNIGVVITILK